MASNSNYDVNSLKAQLMSMWRVGSRMASSIYQKSIQANISVPSAASDNLDMGSLAREYFRSIGEQGNWAQESMRNQEEARNFNSRLSAVGNYPSLSAPASYPLVAGNNNFDTDLLTSNYFRSIGARGNYAQSFAREMFQQYNGRPFITGSNFSPNFTTNDDRAIAFSSAARRAERGRAITHLETAKRDSNRVGLPNAITNPLDTYNQLGNVFNRVAQETTALNSIHTASHRHNNPGIPLGVGHGLSRYQAASIRGLNSYNNRDMVENDRQRLIRLQRNIRAEVNNGSLERGLDETGQGSEYPELIQSIRRRVNSASRLLHSNQRYFNANNRLTSTVRQASRSLHARMVKFDKAGSVPNMNVLNMMKSHYGDIISGNIPKSGNQRRRWYRDYQQYSRHLGVNGSHANLAKIRFYHKITGHNPHTASDYRDAMGLLNPASIRRHMNRAETTDIHLAQYTNDLSTVHQGGRMSQPSARSLRNRRYNDTGMRLDSNGHVISVFNRRAPEYRQYRYFTGVREALRDYISGQKSDLNSNAGKILRRDRTSLGLGSGRLDSPGNTRKIEDIVAGKNAKASPEDINAAHNYLENTNAITENNHVLNNLNRQIDEIIHRNIDFNSNTDKTLGTGEAGQEGYGLTTNPLEAAASGGKKTLEVLPSNTMQGMLQRAGGTEAIGIGAGIAGFRNIYQHNLSGNQLREQTEGGINSLSLTHALNGGTNYHHLDDHIQDIINSRGRLLGENSEQMSQYLQALSADRSTNLNTQETGAGGLASFARLNNVDTQNTSQLFSTLGMSGGLGSGSDIDNNIQELSQQFSGMLRNNGLGGISNQQAQGLNSIFSGMLSSGQTVTPGNASSIMGLQSILSSGHNGQVFQGTQGAQQLQSFSHGIGSSFNDMFVRNAFANNNPRYGGQQGLYRLGLDMQEPLKHLPEMSAMVQNLAHSGLGPAGTELQLTKMGLGPEAARKLYNETMRGNLNPSAIRQAENRDRASGGNAQRHVRKQYHAQGNSTLDIHVALGQQGDIHTSESMDWGRRETNRIRKHFSNSGIGSLLGNMFGGAGSFMEDTLPITYIIHMLFGNMKGGLFGGIGRLFHHPLSRIGNIFRRSKIGGWLSRSKLGHSKVGRWLSRVLPGGRSSIGRNNVTGAHAFYHNTFVDNNFAGGSGGSSLGDNGGSGDNGSGGSDNSGGNNDDLGHDNEGKATRLNDIRDEERAELRRHDGHITPAFRRMQSAKHDLEAGRDTTNLRHVENAIDSAKHNHVSGLMHWMRRGRTGEALQHFHRDARIASLVGHHHIHIIRYGAFGTSVASGFHHVGRLGRYGRLRAIHAYHGVKYGRALTHLRALHAAHLAGHGSKAAQLGARGLSHAHGLFRLGSKGLGRIAAPLDIATTGASVYQDMQNTNGNNGGTHMGQATGDAISGGLPYIGAALGSIIPGAGTAVGGAIGTALSFLPWHSIGGAIGYTAQHPIRAIRKAGHGLYRGGRWVKRHGLHALTGSSTFGGMIRHPFRTAFDTTFSPIRAGYHVLHGTYRAGRWVKRHGLYALTGSSTFGGMIRHPFHTVGKTLTSPFRAIGGIGRGLWHGVKGVGSLAWHGVKGAGSFALHHLGGIVGVGLPMALAHNYRYLREINEMLPKLAGKLAGLFGTEPSLAGTSTNGATVSSSTGGGSGSSSGSHRKSHKKSKLKKTNAAAHFNAVAPMRDNIDRSYTHMDRVNNSTDYSQHRDDHSTNYYISPYANSRYRHIADRSPMNLAAFFQGNYGTQYN